MTYTRAATIFAFALALVTAAGSAWAHSSGALSIDGCHDDRRLHDYHCHRGDLKGKHFESRAEMVRMKQSGEDTSIQPVHPGRMNDLANSMGNENSESDGTAAGLPATAGSGNASVAAQPPMHANAGRSARSIEDRLATLKRLYEKELITKGEYDDKRRELLESL